jgi:hypothetical protein
MIQKQLYKTVLEHGSRHVLPKPLTQEARSLKNTLIYMIR